MWSSKKSKYKKIKQWQAAGDTQARQRLVLMMTDEKEDSLRGEAVRALGAIANEKVVLPLIEALKNDRPQARALAAEALGNHGAVQAVDALIERLTDEDDVVRMRAAEALGKIGDSHATKSLVKMLEDKEWSSHWSAAVALGRIGDFHALGPLLTWVEKVFLSSSKKLTVSEKLSTVRDVIMRYFSKADRELLETLMDDLMMSVRINSWEVVNRQTGEAGWVKRNYENPVWAILQQELASRAPEPATPGEEEAKEEEAGSPTARIKDVEVERPAGTEKVAAAAVPEALPQQPAVLPQLSGVVADFLAFLKSNGLDSAVLVGGGPRDLALGRPPSNLDVTFKLSLPADAGNQSADAIQWNMRFSPQTQPLLAGLARALGADPAELLTGNALFESNGTALNINYVGPYLLEEVQTTLNGLCVEQQVRRTASRIGLVADQANSAILGLSPDATINRMWIDPSGNWGGDSARGLAHLNARELHLDREGVPLTLLEIFRLIYYKHELGFSLSENALDRIEGGVEAMLENPDESAAEFPGEFFARLLTLPDFESLAEDFVLLGLQPLLDGRLNPAQAESIRSLAARREETRASACEEAEQSLEAARQDLIRVKLNYDEKRGLFFRHVDGLDESKSTKYDIESRLKSQSEKLKEAEEFAQKAEARLAEATKNFRSFDPEADFDINILQEHRDALAFKRDRDQAVEALRKEVQGLRDAVEKKHTYTLDLQETLENHGKELEAASRAFKAAQARVQEAEAFLETRMSQMSQTPEQRRARLRGVKG